MSTVIIALMIVTFVMAICILLVSINSNPKAVRKQATAVIIVAIVVAIREAYISGSGEYYVFALLLFLITIAMSKLHRAR